jgi:hypothetical protein
VVPIVQAQIPNNDTVGSALAEALVLAAIMFIWVVEDARRRNIQISALFKMGIVAMGVIFVPIYLIRSRGLRSALKGIAVFGLEFAGCLLGASVLMAVLEMTGINKGG